MTVHMALDLGDLVGQQQAFMHGLGRLVYWFVRHSLFILLIPFITLLWEEETCSTKGGFICSKRPLKLFNLLHFSYVHMSLLGNIKLKRLNAHTRMFCG